MPTTWAADVTLCEVSDIEMRVGDVKALIHVSDAHNVAQQSIANVKADIGNRIKTDVQDIYARSGGSNVPYTKWLVSQGYTYDATDAILDLITNTSELKQAAIFLSIADLLSRSITQFKAAIQTDPGLIVNERDYYAKKGKDELTAAIHRLKIDFSGDGEITDDERVRTQSFFIRA